MQAEDKSHAGVPAVADLLGLQGGVPAPLLLIEAAGEEIHVVVQVPVRMFNTGKARGALAGVKGVVSHDRYSEVHPRGGKTHEETIWK